MVQMGIMSLEPVLTELHNLPVNMMKVSVIQRTYTQMTKLPSPKCHHLLWAPEFGPVLYILINNLCLEMIK